MKAALYVVPTPIGNITDMTMRSIEVLQAVDTIAAEDTRHSRTLLTHYEIATPVVSFHEHSGEGTAVALAQRIAKGERIALISDAGTPLVSDPGYQLVRAAVCAGLEDLGVKIDPSANESIVRGKEGIISTPDSRIQVLVIPANEELVIAREVYRFMQSK